MLVERQSEAVEALVALAATTRSLLCCYTRELDPGLLDAPPVLEALRTLAVRQRGVEIRILMQDLETPQNAGSALIPLAQRLPTSFQLRLVTEPVDRVYAAAFAVNDTGGHYFRPLGHRIEGEFEPNAPGRSRQLREAFARYWERARPCTELRALGL